jgi:porin
MVETEYNHKTTLSGTFKTGMWYHSENFADVLTNMNGVLLANMASASGVTRTHHGNYGFYGVADQKLWNKPDTKDAGLSAFMRFFWNPEDRNVANYQIDAGLNYKGIIASRPDDVLGLGFGDICISGDASQFDRETNFLNGTNAPVRDYESLIELTYQMPILPWLTLQPDFQYIFHPGGNIVDPSDASGVKPIQDAAVVGLRMIGDF